MKQTMGKQGKTSYGLTNHQEQGIMGKRLMLGCYKVEVLTINHAKREIRLLCHTDFTPLDVKNKPDALAAVELQRDNACRYLATEGFLADSNGVTSAKQWCIRAGVVHIKPHDKS